MGIKASGRTAQCILNIDIRQASVVSSALWARYSPAINPGANWKGGRVGHRGGLDGADKRRPLPLPSVEPRIFNCPGPRLVTILTELSRLPHIFVHMCALTGFEILPDAYRMSRSNNTEWPLTLRPRDKQCLSHPAVQFLSERASILRVLNKPTWVFVFVRLHLSGYFYILYNVYKSAQIYISDVEKFRAFNIFCFPAINVIFLTNHHSPPGTSPSFAFQGLKSYILINLLG